MNLDAAIKLRNAGQLELLERLVVAARNLTEPGEPNGEYIRGQANLIVDVIDWGCVMPADEVNEVIAKAIRGEITLWAMMGELLDSEE